MRPFVVVDADQVPEALVLLREIERSGFGRWEARAHVWACAGACACAFRRRGHGGRAHGAGRTFDDAIGEFACEYARQNQRDYELFIEATREGQIDAQVEIQGYQGHAAQRRTVHMLNWRRSREAWLAAVVVALAGCASIGPGTVAVDRFDYSSAIADSWKQQTLLNIVKIRYMDLPVFVDVSSIVAGYSLQTGVSVNGVVSSEHAVQGNYGSIGGQAIYTDRPTITYVPMTGEKFLRGMITPIDPKNIFFMLQAGYPADFILGLTVESLNGVRNRAVTPGLVRPADPGFVQVQRLLRDIQAAGGVSMRVEEDKVRGSTAVLFFQHEDLPDDIRAKSAEVRRLLRLPEDQQRFVLSYSQMRGADGELTVNSRSMLQILQAFASYVDVPDPHRSGRLAAPVLDPAPADQHDVGHIRSGPVKPDQAYVAVRYRDQWFWVEDSDFLTKRALTAVMFFFTLADTGSPDKLPLVTIPAQ